MTLPELAQAGTAIAIGHRVPLVDRGRVDYLIPPSINFDCVLAFAADRLSIARLLSLGALQAIY